VKAIKGKRAAAAETAPDVPRRLNAVVMHLSRALRDRTPGLLGPEHQSALTAVVVGGTVRIGDLARREAVTPPAMTKTVAALEQRGLVRRAPDPQDGRAVRVIATLAGKRLVLRGRDSRITRIRAALSRLDAVDHGRLEAAIDALERLVTEVAGQSDQAD
jgi:DNA-binding MarR family transcriptional regulator